MKKPKFDNLISDFLDAKTYVHTQFFNSKALINFLNFTFNRKVLIVAILMLGLSVLEFSVPFLFNDLFNSEDLITKSFSSTKVLSVFGVVVVFSVLSFLVNKYTNTFIYGIVTEKRKQLFENLFSNVDFNAYSSVSKILNIVDMLSLSVRKFVLNIIQLVSLFFVFTILIVTQYPSLIFLALSVFALNCALIILGSLFARNFVNRNQTMRSILISEVFYAFANRDLLQGELSNYCLQRLKYLSDLDSRFRGIRDTLLFSAKSFLAYLILGFVMLIPILEIYFVNIFSVLSLNFASYVLFGVILSQMLYLSLEIGLFLPVTAIVSQLLFRDNKKHSKRNLAKVSNIRFFSNYLKVSNSVIKNYELIINNSKINKVTTTNNFDKVVLEFSNLKSLRNLFVQVDGKKMRYIKFCNYYKHQILNFSRPVNALYDLFSLDSNLDQTFLDFSEFNVLKPVFKDHLIFNKTAFIAPTKEFELGVNFLRVLKSKPKMIIISKEDFNNSVLQKDLLKLKKQNSFILVVC